MSRGRIRRIFVPLKRKYFELIKQGKKTIELRSEKSPVVKQYWKAPDHLAEFRCGYRGESVLGSLELFWFGKRDNLPDLLLEKACVTQDEVRRLFKPDEKVWAFEVRLIESAIEVSEWSTRRAKPRNGGSTTSPTR